MYNVYVSIICFQSCFYAQISMKSNHTFLCEEMHSKSIKAVCIKTSIEFQILKWDDCILVFECCLLIWISDYLSMSKTFAYVVKSIYITLIFLKLIQHREKKINTSYLTDSYIVFTLKMESVSKITIFGLKIDGEKWSRKNIFEIPQSHFLIIHFTYYFWGKSQIQ